MDGNDDGEDDDDDDGGEDDEEEDIEHDVRRIRMISQNVEVMYRHNVGLCRITTYTGRETIYD